MNRITQFVFFIFLLFLFSCSHHKNDLAKAHLKGEVKSIVESYEPASKEAEPKYKNFLAYNEDGNLVEGKLYYNDSLIFNNVFVYDGKNKLVEKNIYNADSLQEKIRYSYSSSDNIAGSLDYNFKNKTVVKYIYTYDNRNNITEIDGWNSIDSVKKTNTLKNNYKYDDKDNVIEERHFDIKGNLVGKPLSTYDGQGNLIAVDIYGQAFNRGGQKFTYKYDFDKTGNWIKQMISSNDTLMGTKNRAIEYY
jgi:hypothetical protein